MNGEEMTSPGGWLKRQRKARDLTQDALAEQVGCSPDTVRKIEAGKQRPSQQLAGLLAARLEVPPTERAALIHWLRSSIPSASLPGDGTPIPMPLIAAPPPRNGPRPLPVPLTSLIGREAEVGRVHELLLHPEVRLVTLVGPPGIGKTRLALAAGQTLHEAFSGGVWFVELAPLSDPDLVGPAIAAALGFAQGKAWTEERLSRYFGSQQLLLILDNFEHLLAAAPLIARLLKEAPEVKVLATSRTPLRVYGEKEYPVPALAVPDMPARTPLTELAQYAAVRLFVERARDIDPHLRLTEENAVAVGEICARLDGLPLAIELAAARVRVFSPPALLAHLGQPLDLLAGGAHTLPPRQQTLREAIAWSHDLLSAEEQQVFRRFAVFEGGATLEAMAAVCGPASATQRAADAAGEANTAAGGAQDFIFDLVESLVAQSLLRRRAGRDGEPRFWMLETIKEYAGEKLAASGEGEHMRLRHAAFFLTLTDLDEYTATGAQVIAWLARLDDDQDNLRAALVWALAAHTPAQREGLALVWHAGWALFSYLMWRGRARDARRWIAGALEREVALPDALPEGPVRTRRHDKGQLLLAAGSLARWQGDLVAARQLLEQSLTIFQEVDDQRRATAAMYWLGTVLFAAGDLVTAGCWYEESLRISREIGDTRGTARDLTELSRVAYEQGDRERGRALLQEVLAAIRQLPEGMIKRDSLWNLAAKVCEGRDYAAAVPLWEEYWRNAQDQGDREAVGDALAGLAVANYGQANYAAARRLCQEALRLLPVTCVGCNTLMVLAGSEMQLARLTLAPRDPAARSGRHRRGRSAASETGAGVETAQRAARLLGAALELLDTNEETLLGQGLFMEAPMYEFAAVAAREILGEAAFEAARQKGGALTVEQVVAYALDDRTGE